MASPTTAPAKPGTQLKLTNMGVNLLVQFLNNNIFSEKTGEVITAGLLVGNLETSHLSGALAAPRPPLVMETDPEFRSANEDYQTEFKTWAETEAVAVTLTDKEFRVCQAAARAHTKKQTYKATPHSSRLLQQLKLGDE